MIKPVIAHTLTPFQVLVSDRGGKWRNDLAVKNKQTTERMPDHVDGELQAVRGLGCEIALCHLGGWPWESQTEIGFRFSEPDVGEFEVRGTQYSNGYLGFYKPRDHLDRPYVLAYYHGWPRIVFAGYAYGWEIVKHGTETDVHGKYKLMTLKRDKLRPMSEVIERLKACAGPDVWA